MIKSWKKENVENLKGLIEEYPVIGILNMYKMPAPQLQIMRKELKKDAKIKMSKKSLMKLAIENSNKKNIKELEKYLKGQPSFIFTKMNPFELYKYLKNNKTPAPAKAGDVAPKDIIVKKGNTDLPAGPAIGNLSDAGIVSKVQDGKIHVIKDTTVAKEGEEIKPPVANVLNMLGIEPMEIGLDLIVAYENNILFDKRVLDIDEEEFKGKLTNCIFSAINLSINSSYLTDITAPMAIQKAFIEAKTLALEAGIYTKDVIEELLAKANREAMALKENSKK